MSSFETNINEPNIKKKFKELEEKRIVWVDQYNELERLDEYFSHNPYLDCAFLNLLQLFEIIELSNDNDSFYENLTSTKHVSLGTFDWYREFDLRNP